MIELKGVCKVYKSKSGESFKALDNFSYSFLSRGLVGIYGDSGCGKTTLLNLIGGIDTLTNGDILIDNKSLTKFKNKELDAYRNQEIGFIFQDDNLIDNLNVFENVSLALSLRKINGKRRKELVSESLKEVGILDKEKKYPSELSGGEKQRVTIARALIKKPRIILADEPTGSLDKENSFEIMKILKELSKKYLVIVVSHDENLLNEFSDEIIKISKGKIIETRTINKINDDELTLKNEKNKLTSLRVNDGFKLSLKNISYKKFKTFIVSLTLSLSIASLGLVLAIQNGVTSYINTLENETLSRYPVSIESTGLITNDIFELAENEGSFTDEEKVTSSINSNSFLRTNNLSNEFIEYLNNIDEEYKDAIIINDSTPMNVLYFDTLSEKVEHFTSSNNSFLNDFSNNTNIIWRALPQDDEDILNDYDVLKGSYLKNKNEAVLVVNASNEVNQNILNSLGFAGVLDENNKISFDDIIGRRFKIIDNDDFYKMRNIPLNEREVSAIFLKRGYDLYNDNLKLSDAFSYQDLINEVNNKDIDNLDLNEYKDEFKELIKYVDVLDEVKTNIDEIDFNDEEALFNFLSSLVSTRYLDSYRELNEEELLSFYNDESKGTEIKISGIIRPKKDTLVSSLNPGVYYSSILDEEYKNNNNPDFVDLNNDGKISQDEDKRSKIAKSYESNIFVRFDGEFKLCVREIIGDPIESDDYINYILNRTKFGLDESITSITIFPSNFEEKSAILGYIDEYNASQSDENKIIYTDLTAIIFNNLETITNLISLVLIIFSALCLVVAVLLESLISYSNISERKHDIGILKSLGASKKDIFKIFSFESLIVGLISGLISLLLILISGLSLNGFFNSLFDVSGSIVNLSFLLIIIVILLGLFLQFISSFIPTLIYSQKTPIEIMKR